MPKISVILPCYNHENYIRQTMDSLLAQTIQDIEIIAIDDGSQDKTGKILDEYVQKDNRVRVYHQNNAGVAKTLNCGISYARGEWLAFCGSDDDLPPKGLEHLWKRCETQDVVIGEHTCFYDSGQQERVHYPRGKHSFADWMFLSGGAVWGKLFRRAFLVENHICFPPLALEEDVVFIARLAVQHPRYTLVRKSTYHYWNHDRSDNLSLTHRNDREAFIQRLQGKQMMLDLFRQNGFCEEWETHYLNGALLLTSYWLGIFQSEDRRDTFGALQQFILQRNWSNEQKRFEDYFAVSLQQMEHGDMLNFFHENMTHDWKENMYHRFVTGQIGMRYLLKYLKGWVIFKTLTRKQM